MLGSTVIPWSSAHTKWANILNIVSVIIFVKGQYVRNKFD